MTATTPKWRVDEKRRVLCYPVSDDYEYEIDFDTCCMGKEILDWLAQIAEKNWATDAIVGNLVKTLDHVVGLRQQF